MSIVSIKDLLQAGVHFGHQQRFWNPKMEQYIYDTRKQISIINLDLTQEYLNAAASKVEDICSKGNKILFVGTKRSASKTIRDEVRAPVPVVAVLIPERFVGKGPALGARPLSGLLRVAVPVELDHGLPRH